MSSDRIDLHCHSTASDGRLTPAQLVERARSRGIKALALTDHDTIAGLSMFHTTGQKLGLETISGVEISAEYAKGTMHIVGLFVSTTGTEFRAFLKKLSEGRKTRNPEIVRKLNELGMSLTMQEVEAEAGITGASGGGAIDKSVGRPHIASVLIKKGFVKSKQEAFDLYLAKGKPAYVTRFVASPEESIRQIRNAQGLAILAHPPYLNADNDADMDRIVGELKSCGLDGIEVHYSTHTPEQTALCDRLSKKYDLLVSGGSDFHGEDARGGGKVELGSGINSMLNIPYEVLQHLKDFRERRK